MDAEGSQLIVGQHVSQSPSDGGELENAVASIPSRLGRPKAALADAGYVNADAFERLEKEGIELYCSVHREDAHSERYYDFRPDKQSKREVKEPTDPRLIAMREKLRTEEGKAIYGKRNHTVEPVFGIIKEAMGFRSFSLRGKEKVSAEWTLVCLAYNLKRLHQLFSGPESGPSKPKSPPGSDGKTLASSMRVLCIRLARAASLKWAFPTVRSPRVLALTPTSS